MPSDSNSTSDAELLRASLERPELFASLFDRHFPEILGYLRRRINAAVAEDLAAETFTVAFRRRHSFDSSKGQVRPWLYGIATNLLRHEKRREVRELRAYARDACDPLNEDLDPSVSLVERVTAEAEVAGALAKLSRVERDALLLHTWAELSYEEIAEAMQTPVGTVRSRLARARSRMRELLEAAGQVEVHGQVNLSEEQQP